MHLLLGLGVEGMSRREVIRSVTALVGMVFAGLGVIVGMIVLITVDYAGPDALALALVGAFGLAVGFLCAGVTRRLILRRWPLQVRIDFTVGVRSSIPRRTTRLGALDRSA